MKLRKAKIWKDNHRKHWMFFFIVIPHGCSSLGSWSVYDHMCYTCINHAVSWQDATTSCQQSGASLVTISNSMIQAFLESIVFWNLEMTFILIFHGNERALLHNFKSTDWLVSNSNMKNLKLYSFHLLRSVHWKR